MNAALKYNSDQLQQLIISASSYMTKIQAFSNKMSEISISEQLQCLSQCHKILIDQSIPIIKKLFVLRFIKDTLLLASLSFYECVAIKIFPWFMNLSNCLTSKIQETKIAQVGKFLRGIKQLPVAEMSVCKNITNLVQDIIKWMGTYIKDHPYNKIHFRSAFRILLERLPQIQASKLTDLNFFKPEDPNRYQAYYLQKESGELQGDKIGQYIKIALDAIEKGEYNQILQVLVETGDEFVINSLVEEFQTRLQVIQPRTAHEGILLILALHRLFMIGQIEFCNKAKVELIQLLVNFLQMLHYHHIQYKQQLAQTKLVSLLKMWKVKCEQLKIPTASLIQAYSVLMRQGIVVDERRNLTQKSPTLVLNLITQINKDKLSQLDLNQSQTVQKVRMCKYIPLYQSHGNQKSKKQKNSMQEQSQSNIFSSNKSQAKKNQFLQAYSKIPQDKNLTSNNVQLKNNVSQVKQIHFQHSNLSERFHQFNQYLPESSNSKPNSKPLIMSFKRPDPNLNDSNKSPQVVFSDSFNSNQKQLPYKLAGSSKDAIQIIHQPSVSIANSQPSKRVPSEILKLNNSVNKPRSRLHINQNSNQIQRSKVSQISEYYQQSLKQSADIKGFHIEKSKVNDYMMSQKDNELDSVQRSKNSKKQKLQKSSSIIMGINKSKIKSSSNEKQLRHLSSKLSNSRSIKLIYFKEAQCKGQQGYQLPSYTNAPRSPVQIIQVQKTIAKPKFGFKCQDQSVETQEPQSINKDHQKLPNSISISESLSFDPSIIDDSQHINQIPDNFKDILKTNKQKVRVNGFNNKTKQLQIKIKKIKQKKDNIQKQLSKKNDVIAKIKAQMPIPISMLQQQNQKLLKVLKKAKPKHTQNELRANQNYQFKGGILHLPTVPLKQEIKKQILYSKCRLLNDQTLEIGMQVKSKELTIYFTFKQTVEQCSVCIEQNSIRLSEPIEAKIYKIHEGKQIKFKSKITDYVLYDQAFEFPKLKVEVKDANGLKRHLITLPYCLYNELVFHPPTYQISSNKATDWHFCCNGLRQGRHYLQDFLPYGKFKEGIYVSRVELLGQMFEYEVAVEGDKFMIRYQAKNEQMQIPILKCLLSLFERSEESDRLK